MDYDQASTRAERYRPVADAYRDMIQALEESNRYAGDLADDLIRLEPEQEDQAREQIRSALSIVNRAIGRIENIPGLRPPEGNGRGARNGNGPRPKRNAAADAPETRRGEEKNGTVQWFNRERGYGFIAPDDGSKDVFIHISALERMGLQDLETKSRVKFYHEADNRGRDTVTWIEVTG